MKRFLSVSLAVFLGIASASEVSSPMFLAASDVKVEDATKAICYLYDSYTFFDLRSLAGEYQVKSLLGGVYKFGLCQYAKSSNDVKSFLYKVNGDKTTNLTDGALIPDHVYANTNDDGVTYVNFTRESTDAVCQKSEKELVKQKVTFTAMCDTTVTDNTLSGLSINDNDKCDIKIYFANAKGCPAFKATAIVSFFQANPWIIGIILIAFGVVSAFFGGKLFPKVLMAAFGGAVFTIAALLLSAMGMMQALDGKKGGAAISLTVLGFAIALAAGVLSAWFINKIKRIAFMAVGGLAGFFVGFLLYSMLILKFYQATWLYITILVIFIGLGAFLVYKKDKAIIVYLTAFLGGYSLIRGISVFAGGYINELTLASQIMDGTFDPETVQWQFWMYVGAFIVTAILGVVVQKKLKYDEHEHEGYEKVY